jgi:light-regulated signal transduction histidine kinase (bacteriophytochrome)
MMYDEQDRPVDFVYLETNAAFERLTGLQHAVGRRVTELIPGIRESSPGLFEIYGRVARHGTPERFEIFFEPIQAWLVVSVYSPQKDHFVAVFDNITERKRAEETLARQSAELARSNAELEQFAYVASHDLQEPLRKIQAFGDRLRTRAGEALDGPSREDLERMLNAGSRMSTMLEDLLTYSRVSHRGHPFAAVVRDVLSSLETRIEQTHGRVELGELPTIEADRTQMEQLLQNLIGNALKFHAPGQAPEIHLNARAVSEREIQLSVRDNGIGFDEKYLDRIFQPFQRLHSRSETEYPGHGIVLAICRKIAERHGGSITATSQPGQGATFIVTLPREHPADRA